MCTLSTFFKDNELWLGFNRDEQLSRQSGLSPQLYESEGVRYVCPLDGASKGTWIGGNQFGLVVCLLNYYDKTPDILSDHDYRSRGLLVKELLMCDSIESVKGKLIDDYLQSFLPFRLVVLTLEHGVLQLAWDGQDLYEESIENPVVSSSYDVVACSETRGATFKHFGLQDGCLDFDTLLAFHSSHFPEKGALSVCVHRPEVETVSFTGIKLTRDRVEMVYTNGAPCRELLDGPIVLDL